MIMVKAVVLFNLGGPDNQDAVQPFLYNLFRDPAILRVPGPVRWFLAQLISRRRKAKAQGIYAQMGGKSPIRELTQAQVDGLQALLGDGWHVSMCMRYWHPMSDEVVQQVAALNPSEVILLPLYPQFSTTTTQSSVEDWKQAATKAGITAPTYTVGCYPTQDAFVKAYASLIHQNLQDVTSEAPLRLLFSAHGLPEKVIADGDPYQWQVEQTTKAIIAELANYGHAPDHVVCYQSKVGPLAWIGPSTDAEIARAGSESVGVMVIPVAFVSEHSETLVELDIEYRELAHEKGVPAYYRVPALGTQPQFMEGLAELARNASIRKLASSSHTGAPLCPPEFTECACRMAAND
jgi:protoporphyrin/coproporphyrin ferrochelatase